jgi:DNA-binding transcriptional ArsR family regulator
MNLLVLVGVVVASVLALAIVVRLGIAWDRAARAEILRQLADGEWHYGRDLVQASGGALSRGSVYVHLMRMEDEGLVESHEFVELSLLPPYRTPRRVYRAALVRRPG